MSQPVLPLHATKPMLGVGDGDEVVSVVRDYVRKSGEEYVQRRQSQSIGKEEVYIGSNTRLCTHSTPFALKRSDTAVDVWAFVKYVSCFVISPFWRPFPSS